MKENEYEMPEVYQAEYGKYEGDFPFFLNIISEGSALDLACGTGRITRALASIGLDVLGLDASPVMVEFARNQASSLPISYVLGDLRSFSLNTQFDLVTLAGNSFQALHTQKDQINFLKCVITHLRPEGIFALNTRTPQAENLETTSEFEYWHSFTDLSGAEVNVYGRHEYDENTQIMTYFTKRVWDDHETLTRVKLHFAPPKSIFKTLKENGFEVLEAFSSVSKAPLHEESKELYLLCKRSK